MFVPRAGIWHGMLRSGVKRARAKQNATFSNFAMRYKGIDLLF